MSIALEGIQQDGYQLGNFAAIKYDRNDPIFGDEYLVKLYHLCRQSGRRSEDGILSSIFQGNPPSNLDSIVSYLASHPPIIIGEWEDDKFVEGGFAFPVVTCGTPATERSMFIGYGMFKHVWGQPKMAVMAMLGLSFFFQELGLVAIHGTRYPDNTLTERFMSQFGFKRTGLIPRYQLKNGHLVDGIVTSLLREDFEAYVERFLVEQYRAEMAEAGPEPEADPEPAVPAPEEKPEEPPQLSLGWL